MYLYELLFFNYVAIKLYFLIIFIAKIQWPKIKKSKFSTLLPKFRNTLQKTGIFKRESGKLKHNCWKFRDRLKMGYYSYCIYVWLEYGESLREEIGNPFQKTGWILAINEGREEEMCVIFMILMTIESGKWNGILFRIRKVEISRIF